MASELTKKIPALDEELVECASAWSHPHRAFYSDEGIVDGTETNLANAVLTLLLVKLIEEGYVEVDKSLLDEIGYNSEGNETKKSIACYRLGESWVDDDSRLRVMTVVSLLRRYGWTVDPSFIFSPDDSVLDGWYGGDVFEATNNTSFHVDSFMSLNSDFQEYVLKEIFQGIYDEDYLYCDQESLITFFDSKESSLDSEDYACLKAVWEGRYESVAEHPALKEAPRFGNIAYTCYEQLDIDEQDEFEKAVGLPGLQFMCVFHEKWQAAKTLYTSMKRHTKKQEALYEECAALARKVLQLDADYVNVSHWRRYGSEYDVYCFWAMDDPSDGSLFLCNPMLNINVGGVLLYAEEFDRKVEKFAKCLCERKK